MSRDILISVIVPVYKTREDYLIQCIESIIRQSLTNIEIILVDDNNNEDISGKICDEFALKYTNVVSIHQKNGGVSVARNNGMDIAKGEWIAFVDSDDWIEPNYFAKLYEKGQKYQADIVMCSCYANYSDGEKKNIFFQYESKIFTDNMKDEILLQLVCRGINKFFPVETGVGVPWAKLYRKKFLTKNKLRFDSTLIRMQDNIFNLYAVEKADNVYFFNEALYHYRKYNDSVTRKYNPSIITFFENINRATMTFIKENNKNIIFKKAYYAKELLNFNSYINLYFEPAIREKKLSKKKAIKKLRFLLDKPNYKEAIQNLDGSILNLPERIYVQLIKRKKIRWVLWITAVNNAYKRFKNGIPAK